MDVGCEPGPGLGRRVGVGGLEAFAGGEEEAEAVDVAGGERDALRLWCGRGVGCGPGIEREGGGDGEGEICGKWIKSAASDLGGRSAHTCLGGGGGGAQVEGASALLGGRDREGADDGQRVLDRQLRRVRLLRPWVRLALEDEQAAAEDVGLRATREKGGDRAPGLLAGPGFVVWSGGLGAVGDDGEDARGVGLAGVVRGVVDGVERELEVLGRAQERSDGAVHGAGRQSRRRR